MNKNFTYALFGASHDPEKFGSIVFHDLIGSGYKVLPLNPKGGTLSGHHVYKSIAEIKEHIDVAIFVIPPAISTQIVENDLMQHKIDKVWFQPGSDSTEAVAFCKEHDIQCSSNLCIMKERTKDN